MTTLKKIEVALRKPFAVEDIQFQPRQTRQHNGRWECLAQPCAIRRAYEDRLNELLYGEWHTPPSSPIIAGHRLIMPVTVVVWATPYTGYGEALLVDLSPDQAHAGRQNVTDAAWIQGFARACAQFKLGAYLADLRPLWLPYDPATDSIPIAESERIAWVEKLYMECGLQPRAYRRVIVPLPACAPTAPLTNGHEQPATQATSAALATATDGQQFHQTSSAGVPLVDQKTLAWITEQLGGDPMKVEEWCTFYQVSDLKDLTCEQAIHLMDSIDELEAPPKDAQRQPQETETSSLPRHAPSQKSVDPSTLKWILRKIGSDPVKVKKACAFYQVAKLADLTQTQANRLCKYIRDFEKQQQGNVPSTAVS